MFSLLIRKGDAQKYNLEYISLIFWVLFTVFMTFLVLFMEVSVEGERFEMQYMIDLPRFFWRNAADAENKLYDMNSWYAVKRKPAYLTVKALCLFVEFYGTGQYRTGHNYIDEVTFESTN